MSTAHPIPAAIDGLVTLWSGHGALAYEVNDISVPLLVIDGPPLSDFDDQRVLAVGVSSTTITGGLSPFAHADAAGGRIGFGAGGRRTVHFEVTCQLGVWSGDTAMSAVRTTTFEVFETLNRLLTADRTLSGVVDWARIIRVNYQPMQGPDGSGVAVDFVVAVEATQFDGD